MMRLPLTLTCPLPAADLSVESLSATYGLSELGEMQLDLVSARPDIRPRDLLGKTMAVTLHTRSGADRHFHGYVTRFGLRGSRGRFHGYQATVRPWLWFLTRTADCRVFQDLTVPDIVKKVFQDHADANVEFKLFREYRTWTYCVQYRESDFSFVSRLLEHEGIYWYIEHGASGHKLVLVDAHSAHDLCAGTSTLAYEANPELAPLEADFITNWSYAGEVCSGKAVLTSYDFERPSASLVVQQASPQSHAQADQEVFDFQGDYTQATHGKQWAENRMDELLARHEIVQGHTSAQLMACGHRFKLARHPVPDQNREYLIVSESIHAKQGTQESAVGDFSFSYDFTAMPATRQFRPPRHTTKPFVQGPQTAVVVGPSGDEIFTDKYGRVKVQFHWDRLGRKDEKSSCWVRVSHPWAGKNFGMIHIPRIGQEVVVSFLEGDPDQPLITGRVYNAEQMPPWELPANATQSGILTRSSKGGAYGNANAIRFEDKKGHEQLWIHAEKNQDIEVENDETHWVGHDRTKTIDHDETVHVKHDRTETVDNNERITIGVNRTEAVGNNEVISIGNDQTETIGGSMMLTVSRTKTETIGINSAETIGAAKELTIGGLYQVTVGAAHNTTVGGAKLVEVGAHSSEMVGGAKSLTVGGNHTQTVGGAEALSIAGDRSLKVDGNATQTIKGEHVFKAKKIDITAEEELNITVGSAKLILKKDGTILIDGKDVTTKASGKVNVKASGDLLLKGSTIKGN